MAEGGLVPFELTVQILINGLIARPSKNYLIDGFPRAVDQAIYFEQNVCECQNVLFYDVNEETLLERCLVRAANATVQREDDNAETLKNRLRNFRESSKPVVDLYRKLGKVRCIDASESITKVYEETRKALLPQVSFMVGPTKAGKTTLAVALAERTNMSLLDYTTFLKDNGLLQRSEEEQTKELIKYLVEQPSPRVLIEEFPQTENQAKYFSKNCVEPTNVFYVRCSLDESQERMLSLGKDSTAYLPSTILSKKIRLFNDHAVKLLPYLRKSATFVEVDTGAQPFEKAFKEVCAAIEPTILHIRSHADAAAGQSDELQSQILWTLTNNHGYAEVNVNELVSLENERKTEIGKQLMLHVAQGKLIPADIMVRLLRKIVYSGDGRTKYILSGGFPFTVEHAKEFENHIANISAVIYSALQYEDSAIHVKGSLSEFSIATLFQKDFRLRVLTDWDEQNWQELFDAVKIDWTLVLGQPLTGKTTLATTLKKTLGATRVTLVDPKEIEAAIKLTMGTPEEPFEGKVPLHKVEDAIVSMISKDKKAGKKITYVFDSFPGHPTATEFARFTREKLRCPPDFVVSCQVQEQATLAQRFKKKLEVEADLSEEQQEQFKQMMQEYADNVESYIGAYAEPYIESGRTKLVIVDTSASSEETVGNVLKDAMAPKVILVNHEKRLPVDAICANIGIKYNFMYLSVYQLIKQHITEGTLYGKRLQAGKKTKALELGASEAGKDEF